MCCFFLLLTQVAFVAYKDGDVEASMVFDGTGTNNVSWFSKSKLLSNSHWQDLNDTSNNFFRSDNDA